MICKNSLSKEVSSFISFLDRLHSFSLQVRRVENPDDFCGEPSIYKSKMATLALVFVGDPDVIRGTHYGYEPYVDFVEKLNEEGIDTFYLLARGKMNTLIADATAKIVEDKTKLQIIDRYVDEAQMGQKIVDTVCIRLEKYNSMSAQQKHRL